MSAVRVRVAIAAACALLLGAPAPIGAQQTRDGAVAARGSAALSGTVVADDTGRPVGRALVTVKGLAPAFAQATSTDEQGRFAFAALPPGDVTVTATKTTYLTAYFGAHDRIRGPAVPFAIANGAAPAITLRLVRGAVIAGTVKGLTGRPQAGVQVSARHTRVSGGERRAVGGLQGKGGQTDDLGHYRIWGLPPGDYLVEATPANAPGSARSITDADVQAAAASALRGRTAPPPPAAQPQRIVRLSPVYYPDVVDAAQAAAVPIGAGEERDGIDLTLRAVPTADLRGIVIGADGRPAGRVPVALRGGLEPRDDVTDDAGRFAFLAVAPGTLTLLAGGASQRAARDGAPPENLWASLEVTVSGDDQDGLTLNLRPGMTAAGRVTFESPSAAVNPAAATIVFTPAGDEPGTARPAQTNAAADGTFTVTGLAPGRYRVQPAYSGESGAASPWIATSVLYQGQDLLDGTIDIAPGDDISGLAVVFSDRETDLRGTFLDSAGRPVAGYDVVVFAADRRFWTPGSRRINHVLLRQDGRFDFSSLPAGDYLLAAVTHADPDDLADPDWLDAIAPLALHVTLAAGEHKVQDIRLGK